jgi:hypothetical protein
MTQTLYVSPVTPGTVLGFHDVLRVTFAEEPHFFVPDHVAYLNFKAQVDNLIRRMEAGGFSLAPASDVNVPPGAKVWTIDFIAPSGYAVVGPALSQMDEALEYGLIVNSNAYIARVEKVRGAAAGAPDAGDDRAGTSLTFEEQLQQTELGAMLARVFGKAIIGLVVVGGITLAIIYAP